MSQREIAATVGVSVGTVNEDLKPDVQNRTPEEAQPPSQAELPTVDVQNRTPEPESTHANGGGDILISHINGLSNLRKELKPAEIAADVHINNRLAFAKQLRRNGAYLDAIAANLEEE